jgi:hypothetical protein
MTLRLARRIAVIAIVVSLSATALIGIVTLFSGDFGDIQARVMFSTLMIAGFSITVLCHLAVVGRALQVVGFVGVGFSVVALATSLVLLWRDSYFYEDTDFLVKTAGVTAVLAISFAHANLLLLLGQRRNRVVRVLLYVTVALVAIVALLVCLPIATGGEIPGNDGDTYWRLLGVAAILDVLGTIVLPVTGRLLRDDRAARLELTLSEHLDARLSAAAQAAGTSKAEAAIAALESALVEEAPAGQ